jgi:uncharacterized protein YdaU (DUF1376 family)
MSKDLGPFIPLYYGDFLSGTMSFGAEEVGAYLLLLCQQWQSGGIENDPSAIERIARCEYGKLRRVLAKFDIKGSMLVNLRCDVVRNERQRYMEAKRRAGEAGADARWHGDGITNGTPNGKTMRMPCISSSSSSSSSQSPSEKRREEGKAPPSRNLQNEPPTFEECVELCAGIGMRQTDLQAFFDHYDSQGWRKSNGQAATNLRSLMSAWKNKQQQFAPAKKGSNYDDSIS